MKIVLQRVKNARVKHEQNIVSEIQNGLVLLVGFTKDENKEIVRKIVKKILNAKVFGRWDKSVIEMEYEVLVLSQFTLYGKLNGRKPDFHNAEKHEKAKIMFEDMVKCFMQEYNEAKIKCGLFGMHLEIELINDGPVTLVFDEN